MPSIWTTSRISIAANSSRAGVDCQHREPVERIAEDMRPRCPTARFGFAAGEDGMAQQLLRLLNSEAVASVAGPAPVLAAQAVEVEKAVDRDALGAGLAGDALDDGQMPVDRRHTEPALLGW